MIDAYPDFMEPCIVRVVIRCELEVDARECGDRDPEEYAKELVLSRMEDMRVELGHRVVH